MQKTYKQRITTTGNPPQSEAQLQSRCVVWFKNTFRDLRDLYFQIKNDGKKHKIAGSLDTAMGLTPGIPDTFLAIPRLGQEWWGLYIEFKTPTGRVSKDQERVFHQLRLQGYRVEVIRTEEEFRTLIQDYLSLQ
mgnify:CR=1 FL=1